MARSISQTIRLEGAEEIPRLLAGIGSSGGKAFAEVQAAAAAASVKLEQVAKAVESAERSFASVAAAGRNFGGAVQNLGSQFNQFERALSSTVTRTTVFVGAIAAAAAGLAKFVVSGIKAADDIEEQAAALGLSAQRYQELGFAASESGVKTGQFASAMRRFSQEVQQESDAVSKGIVKFLGDAAKGFDDWGGRIKLVGNQTGATFSLISEGAAKLQRDLAAQGITRPLFQIQEQLRKLALGGAEARKEFERLTGIKLPSSADGLDKLREQADGTKDAIRKLGLELKKSADGQIDTSDALGQLADKFRELPDGAQKTALAMDIFGRAAGPAMIPFLNQGRAGIEGLLAEARKLGLFMSKDQIEAAGKAARAYDIMARAATTAKNSFAAAFAPLTTAAATGLTEFLSRNKQSLDEFAAAINTRALPYVKAFFDLISGRTNDSAEAQQLVKLKDQAVALGETLRSVATVIGQAFSIILGVLDQVAAGFNLIFGTNLSGAALGIILVITKLVGGFTLLLASVRLVGAVFTTLIAGLRLAATGFGLVVTAARTLAVVLAATLSWPVLLAAAIAAGIALIIANWEKVSEIAGQVLEFIKRKAGEAKDAFLAWIGAKIDGAWNWVVDAFNGVVEKIKQKALELAEFLKRTLTQSPDRSGASVPGGVPLLGQSSPFDRLPESQNIEDRRSEISEGATANLGAIRQLAEDVAALVAQSFEQLKAAAATAMQETVAVFTGGADLIGTIVTGAFQRASDASTNLIAQLATAVQQMMDSLATAVNSVIASVDASIAAVISRLEQAVQRAQELAAAAAAAVAAAGTGGGGGAGFAGGGYTGDGGRLTPAGIVHRGEYVQPQRVVRQPGVLAFLEALRRSGGDLQNVIRRFARGFSAGGLVDSLRSGLAASHLPSFADGGLVPAMAGLPNMGTLDLRTDSGTVRLTVVQNDAVEQLQRMNVRRQLARIGKPARG